MASAIKLHLLGFMCTVAAFSQVPTPLKVYQSAGSISGEIWLQEPRSGGQNWWQLSVPVLAGDKAFVAPAALPASNGECLKATTAGVLSFAACDSLWTASGGDISRPTGLVTVGGTFAVTGISTLTGNVTVAGTITSNTGITVSTTGNANFQASGGAFGDAGLNLSSNSGGKQWQVKSGGTTGDFTIRDVTSAVDRITVTSAGQVQIPGAFYLSTSAFMNGTQWIDSGRSLFNLGAVTMSGQMSSGSAIVSGTTTLSGSLFGVAATFSGALTAASVSVSGTSALTGNVTVTGTITSNTGITVSTTGNANFQASGGAFGDAGLNLSSNSGGKQWQVKSGGTTGDFTIRDVTSAVDRITITSAGQVQIPGTLRFANGAVNGYFLTTDGSGNATWAANGSGTVTSIATTSPITGGTITTSGTIACATCVTTDTTQTISGTKTFSAGITANGGIATGSSSNSTIYVGSGNLYIRSFSGADASCTGITNGWIGLRTDTNEIQMCNGGVMKKVALT